MIKRYILFLLLSVSFLLMFTTAIHADVIIERELRQENDFYTWHKHECLPLEEYFTANGTISLKKEPGSGYVVDTIEEGTELYIKVTHYYNGEMWGYTEIYRPERSWQPFINGWVPMNELSRAYNYLSFISEHREELYSYSKSYYWILKSDKETVLWSWPGSGIIKGIFKATADEDFYVSYAYKDGEGREWIFIRDFHYSYSENYSNVWICVSDPGNSDIPAFNPPPNPDSWQSLGANIIKGVPSMPFIIFILVTVLVFGTVALVRVFWKPNKDKTN